MKHSQCFASNFSIILSFRGAGCEPEVFLDSFDAFRSIQPQPPHPKKVICKKVACECFFQLQLHILDHPVKHFPTRATIDKSTMSTWKGCPKKISFNSSDWWKTFFQISCRIKNLFNPRRCHFQSRLSRCRLKIAIVWKMSFQASLKMKQQPLSCLSETLFALKRRLREVS